MAFARLSDEIEIVGSSKVVTGTRILYSTELSLSVSLVGLEVCEIVRSFLSSTSASKFLTKSWLASVVELSKISSPGRKTPVLVLCWIIRMILRTKITTPTETRLMIRGSFWWFPFSLLFIVIF